MTLLSRYIGLAFFVMSGFVCSTRAEAVNNPDLTLQAISCLAAGGEEESQIKSFAQAAVQEGLNSRPELFTNPSFQIGCVGGRETIGIWFARQSALSDLTGVDILSPHQAVMAMQMTNAAASFLVGKEWSHYQAENPTNAYRYDGYALTYDQKHSTVKATFKVSKSALGKIRVHASVDLLDSLSLTSGGFPACSTAVSFHYDANEADAFLGLIVPLPFSYVLVNYLNGLTLYSGGSAAYGEFNNELIGDGLGCAFATFVPTTILTPANSSTMPPTPPGKLVFGFRQISVSNTAGMTFFTQNAADIPLTIKPRDPAVFEASPFLVHVYASASAASHISARLAIGLRDLRPNPANPATPFNITWLAKSGKIVSTANGSTFTLATFGAIPAGSRFIGAKSGLGSVTVHVTDIDNVSATQTFPVFALVEKDPVGPPKKNSGKLIFK